MKSLSMVLAVVLGIVVASTAVANSPPVVTNVQASQVPGTGDVEIRYDVADADGDSVAVRVICSADGGTTFTLYARTIYESPNDGIGNAVPPGTGKLIRWNAAADYPGQYWSSVTAKVIATDGAGVGGEMLLIPAGEFLMGSNAAVGCTYCAPIHAVNLSAFWMDKYEVTNAEYAVFMNAGGYTTQAYWSLSGWAWVTGSEGRTQPLYWGQEAFRSGPGWPGFPVIGVNWHEAGAYAMFAGKRLPSEAEWEKAARGTDQRKFPWGNAGPSVPSLQTNFDNSGDPYESGSAELTPVGFYDGRYYASPPFQTQNTQGPYGAYDQAGNVGEWVRDWFANYYPNSPYDNPQGPISGSSKIFRGGAWSATPFSPSEDLATYDRAYGAPTFADPSIGFRCAKDGP